MQATFSKMRLSTLFLIISTFSLGCSHLNKPTNSSSPKAYQFNEDWFSHNIPNWKVHLKDLVGKPNIKYLEIRIWEGRSFFWILDNVFTESSTLAYAVDPWEKITPKRIAQHNTFMHNLEASGRKSQTRIKVDFSENALKQFEPNYFDLIYIDGNQSAKTALQDVVLAWLALKPDGILIFDDYLWNPNYPLQKRPQFSIDAFLKIYEGEYELIQKDYQLIVKKKTIDKIGS